MLRHGRMMEDAQMVDGTSLQVVHNFGNGRAILRDRGVFIMADRVSQVAHVEEWDPSGEPARPGPELEMLNSLVKATEAETTVVVTRDDDSAP